MILDAAHRVQGVPQQVQDDLLELDPISCDTGDVATEFRSQNHPAFLKFALQKRNHLVRGLVEIYRFVRRVLLAKERTQSRDHIRRTVGIANRAPRGLARAVDIWRIGSQHPQTGTGVGDDARQRLVDFVRDRRRQCSKARDPGHVRELRPDLAECLFRESALRDVLNRADVFKVTAFVSGPMSNNPRQDLRRLAVTQPCPAIDHKLADGLPAGLAC